MALEDDDDREFMQKLYVDYHRLMYSQITKIAKDHWVADDVLHLEKTNRSSASLQ